MTPDYSEIMAQQLLSNKKAPSIVHSRLIDQ